MVKTTASLTYVVFPTTALCLPRNSELSFKLFDTSSYHSLKKSFLVLSDSLSSLLALQNVNYDHPFLIKIHELHSELIQDGKEIVSVWVPGHVGISGNLATDSDAKDALDGDTSDEYIPVLKPRLNDCIVKL